MLRIHRYTLDADFPPHCDLGLLTLAPKASVPGLQVQSLSSGGWIAIEEQMGEEEAVLFGGLTLTELTGLTALPHKVDRGGQDRLSAPYFLRASPDQTLPPATTTTNSTATATATAAAAITTAATATATVAYAATAATTMMAAKAANCAAGRGGTRSEAHGDVVCGASGSGQGEGKVGSSGVMEVAGPRSVGDFVAQLSQQRMARQLELRLLEQRQHEQRQQQILVQEQQQDAVMMRQHAAMMPQHAATDQQAQLTHPAPTEQSTAAHVAIPFAVAAPLAMARPVVPMSVGAPPTVPSRVRESWGRLDGDADGRLTLDDLAAGFEEEFVEVCEGLGMPAHATEALARLFNQRAIGDMHFAHPYVDKPRFNRIYAEMLFHVRFDLAWLGLTRLGSA